MSEVIKNYHQIVSHIDLAQQLSSFNQQVELLAVSKSHSIQKIEELYHVGHRDFAENYVQELESKAHYFLEKGITDIRWHFIGHLQTNKVKKLLPWVTSIHTLNSLKLAKEIEKYYSKLNRSHQLPVFIEVNIDHEKDKSGIHPSDISLFLNAAQSFPSLEIKGLMCIPNPRLNSREKFIQLRKLHSGKLSMGMSNDFEIAIHEGATHVRIGHAIFGKRSTHSC